MPRGLLPEAFVQQSKLVVWSEPFAQTCKHDHCAICHEIFSADVPDICRVLDCSHVFHAKCVDLWFIKATFCPLCKSDLKQSVRALSQRSLSGLSHNSSHRSLGSRSQSSSLRSGQILVGHSNSDPALLRVLQEHRPVAPEEQANGRSHPRGSPSASPDRQPGLGTTSPERQPGSMTSLAISFSDRSLSIMGSSRSEHSIGVMSASSSGALPVVQEVAEDSQRSSLTVPPGSVQDVAEDSQRSSPTVPPGSAVESNSDSSPQQAVVEELGAMPHPQLHVASQGHPLCPSASQPISVLTMDEAYGIPRAMAEADVQREQQGTRSAVSAVTRPKEPAPGHGSEGSGLARSDSAACTAEVTPAQGTLRRLHTAPHEDGRPAVAQERVRLAVPPRSQGRAATCIIPPHAEPDGKLRTSAMQPMKEACVPGACQGDNLSESSHLSESARTVCPISTPPSSGASCTSATPPATLPPSVNVAAYTGLATPPLLSVPSGSGSARGAGRVVAHHYAYPRPGLPAAPSSTPRGKAAAPIPVVVTHGRPG